MGFNKDKNEPDIAIEVRHPWHPGDVYTFYFPKKLPQLALDAEAKFLGLKEGERSDEYRKELINTVAAMVTREPEGFDHFPTDEVLPAGQSPRSLSIRMRDYFDDPNHPELESILVGVWRAYRASAVPSAYLKSLPADSKGDGSVSRGTAQAESGT